MGKEDIKDWLESLGKPIVAPTENGVWIAACTAFYGRPIGGYDLGLTFLIEDCGYRVRAASAGGYILAKVT